MQPLAYRVRPLEFKDVYGQDHLIGPNGVLTKMVERKKWMSFILFGPPGTGKTTIAQIFSRYSTLETFFFNASTDNKAKLVGILDTTNFHNVMLIIDEIHRMKSDIQDYLLPFMESGKAIVVGMTTTNPYFSINMAIRSRCHIYEVKDLSNEDIKKAIMNGVNQLDVKIAVSEGAMDAIIRFSNREIRTALNLLESTSLILNDGDVMNANHVRSMAAQPALNLDHGEDHYYSILSAFQKSIRGSDVDASLHYLARLVVLGDLNIIMRRLLVIAYEDIGLANPTMGQKVLAACEVAKKVGLPEARVPLSTVVIEMAISPKSNTALLSIDKAIADFTSIDTGTVPDHANNAKIKINPEIYHYSHDYPNSLNDQTYLPEKIKNRKYFIGKKESSYEKALSDRNEQINKIKKK